MREEIEIRGNASPEELAAVLAVVAQADSAPPREPDAYTRWRQGRLRALRPTAPPAEHRAR